MKRTTADKQQTSFPRCPSVILSDNMRKELQIVQTCKGHSTNSATLRYVLKQGLEVLGRKRS